MLSKIEECIQTHKPHEMQNEFTHNNGTLGWFDLRIEPIDDGIIIFSFDVTAQKQLENKIKKLNNELDEKLASSIDELEKKLPKAEELDRP